jgi:predicted outer membrane protein
MKPNMQLKAASDLLQKVGRRFDAMGMDYFCVVTNHQEHEVAVQTNAHHDRVPDMLRALAASIEEQGPGGIPSWEQEAT